MRRRHKDKRRLWNRLAALLLCLSLGVGTVGVSPLTALTVNAADVTWQGEGTEESPYLISNVAELQKLATDVNNGTNMQGKHFKLTTSLDLSSVENWTPIGNKSCFFQGTFDGDFHVIRNMKIQNTNRIQYFALFGRLMNATIKNLGIENADVSSVYSDVAILAGNAQGGVISKCYVTGKTQGDGAVGGILGSTYSSSNTTKFDNCYARVSLNCTSVSKAVAGIAGWNESKSLELVNCISACIGERRPVAGWSNSSVSAQQIQSTYFDKTLSPNFVPSDGRTELGKTSEELKRQSTYSGWDFKNTWALDPEVNGGYPYIKGFTPGLLGAPGSITITIKDQDSGKPVTDVTVTAKNPSNEDDTVDLKHQGDGVYSGIVNSTNGSYDIYVGGEKKAENVTFDKESGTVQQEVSVVTKHSSHNLCADANCTHTESHENLEWKPWSLPKPSALTTMETAFPKSPGNYYLTEDLVLPAPKQGDYIIPDASKCSYAVAHITNDTNLCLNGHVIRYEGSMATNMIRVFNGASLTITDCRKTPHKFSENQNGQWTLDEENGTETLYGGCLINKKSSALLISNRTNDPDQDMPNVTLYHANIVGSKGTGIVFTESSLTMEDCVVAGNISGGINASASMADAGAYTDKTSRMILNDVKIMKNHNNEGNGGGINISNLNHLDFQMNGGEISGNVASKDGGGLYVSPNADSRLITRSITLNGVKAEGNTAGNWGGGLYLEDGQYVSPSGEGQWKTDILLQDVAITGNKAKKGGGISYHGKYDKDAAHTRLEGRVIIKDNQKIDNKLPDNLTILYTEKSNEEMPRSGALHIGALTEEAHIGIGAEIGTEIGENTNILVDEKEAFSAVAEDAASFRHFYNEHPDSLKIGTREGQLLFSFRRMTSWKVIKEIEALSRASMNNKDQKTVAARNAYSQLTNEQKSLVYNISKLVTEEKRMDSQNGGVNQAAAAEIEDLIDQITVPVTYTEESKQQIEDAQDAFDNLTGTQKDMVSDAAKEKLESAKDAYDQLAAGEAIEKIDEIPTKTEGSDEWKQTVDEARDAYDKLTDDQKGHIPSEKKDVLTNAESKYDTDKNDGADRAAAAEVEKKIDAIDLPVEDTIKSGYQIDEAKRAFDALTTTQQDMVDEEHTEKLKEACDTYDGIKVEEVIEKISKIETITNNNYVKQKPIIDDARMGYDNLTESQKERVPSDMLKKLLDAEKAYDALAGGKIQAAVDDVIAKIDAIETPITATEESGAQIEAAEDAYSELSPTQKEQIDEEHTKKLDDARNEYDQKMAEEVKKKIDDIAKAEEGSDEWKKAIEDARDAYDKLTEEQKKLIDDETKKLLTDAEKAHDDQDKSQADQNAAKAVEDLIHSIQTPITGTEENKTQIDTAEDAYDALTGTQKDMVSEEAEQKLKDSKDAYDKVKADEVKDKILEIINKAEGSDEWKTAIEDARNSYDTLTEEQKELIDDTVKKLLTDSELKLDNIEKDKADQTAAKEAIKKIDAIQKPVTASTESKQQIDAAREAYDALTTTQKDMVPEEKVNKLVNAEKEYQKLNEGSSKEILEKLEELGEVNLDNAISKEDAILDLWEAYQKLSEDQKELLDAVKQAHDMLQAAKVRDLINAIETPLTGDDESSQAINDAKSARVDLTEDQEKLIPEELNKLDDIQEAQKIVESILENLTDITEENVLDNSYSITGIRYQYNDLSSTQKDLIADAVYQRLTNAEDLLKIAQLEKMIDQLGDVDISNASDKEPYITIADETFQRLSEKEQGEFDPVRKKKLEDAVNALEAAKALAKINAIEGVTEETAKEREQEILDARETFDALTEDQKKLLPEGTEKKLTDAENALDAANGGGDADAAVKAVENKIDALGDVTLENATSKKQAITEAQTAFQSLSKEQQGMVPEEKRKKLENAVNTLKAAEALEKINAIEGVTEADAKEKEQEITDARDAFDKLTDEQKQLLPDGTEQKLTDAEKALDAANGGGEIDTAVKAVEDKIDAIGDVTLENALDKKQAITEAKDAFDKLTDEQKGMISDAGKKKLKDTEDKLKAAEAIAKIDAIGNVTLDNAKEKKPLIDDARNAYDKLTKDQQALIPEEKAKKLADAEEAYKKQESGIFAGLSPEEKAQIKEIYEKLGVSEETAVKIKKMADELGVDPETLLVTEGTIAGSKSENDIKGSSFGKLQLKTSKVNEKSTKLTWKKVNGADGYLVYGTRCGKNNAYQLMKEITKPGTKSYTQKRMTKGKFYRFLVRAYKLVDGKKITIAASKSVHIVTAGGKYGNAKGVKVQLKKNRASIKKGKKLSLKGSEIKGKKAIRRHRGVMYESSDSRIATVTKKGVIKAKAKGKCKIYAYAQNGFCKTVNITVK